MTGLNPKLRKDSRGVWYLDWTKDVAAVAYDIITPTGAHVQAGKSATSSKLGKLAEPFPMPQIASALAGPYQAPANPFEQPVPVPPDPGPPASNLGGSLPKRLVPSTGTVRRPAAADSGSATDAVNACKPGDIVELPSGDYGYINAYGRNGTAAAPITIRPAAGAKITVRRVDFQDSSFIRFTGEGGSIYVTDPTDEYDLNLRIFRSNALEISFCELGKCSQPIYAGDSSGTSGKGSSNIHILGCYIHDAGWDGNKEHGVYLGYGMNPGWVFASNLIVGTRARGVQFYSDFDGNEFSDGFVVNNTIVRAGLGDMRGGTNGDGAETYGYGLRPDMGWRNMVTANNISFNNQRIGYAFDGSNTGGLFKTNLGWNNPEGDVDSWPNVQDFIHADPKLDAANKYKPLAGSPVIGRGIPEYTPPYGVLGAVRKTADLGAVPA